MKPLIWGASIIWSSASWAARRAATHGFLPSEQLDSRVISVGNLQAGGSGKTPIVAQIAREAAERGLSVCILSRGYRSEWEKVGGVLEPGSDPDPALTGDEPALLRHLAPAAWIAIGRDRAGAYRKAQKRFGKRFDLVVLDDGFQHWKIKRDLEVLAITSDTATQRLFRDWPSQMKIADLIVWTKGDRQPFPRNERGVKLRFKVPEPKENDRSVWLVCGVGDPASVKTSMRESGWIVKHELLLNDHARFRAKDVAAWMREADQEGCKIAITGKDWVKWRALGIHQTDVHVIEPELVFEAGRELWEKTLWG